MDSTTKLIKELEEHLPVYFHPTPQLCQISRKQGKIINRDSELKVTNVFDSGDTGGIVCAVEDVQKKEVFVVSLTHLIINQNHPLWNSISNYQRERVNKLKNK